MADLYIDEFIARYSRQSLHGTGTSDLPPGLREMLDTELHRNLAGIGVAAHEHVCIREIHVPVRLDMALSGRGLAAEWSRQFTETLRRRLRRGGIVRYASRREALLDMALSAVSGDASRAWAWERLGYGALPHTAGATAIAGCLYEALVDEPTAIVPLLKALGRRDRLAGFVPLLQPKQWRTLSKRALGASGIQDTDELFRDDRGKSTNSLERALLSRFDAALRRSAIATVLGGTAAKPGGNAEIERALAILAIIETDAALVRIHPDPIRGMLSSRPASPRKPAPAANAEEAGPRVETVRPRAETDWGGLLFLLAVVERSGLAGELDRMSAELDRSVQWILYQVALHLAPLEAGDPAARAFAGLGPEDALPAKTRLSSNDERAVLIRAACKRIVLTLTDLLSDMADSPDGWVCAVCRRRAVLYFDPGWIDVHMSHDSVSTEIRRAGLDLDPGYLPWLGSAVRFIYDGAPSFSAEGRDG